MLRIKPRVTMHSRVLFFLIGAAYIYHMVLAYDEEVIAELMVESNVTLDTNTILLILNKTTELELSDAKKVTITGRELIAECLITGDETSCNCSVGYIWSNDVCYSSSDTCCREETCKKNVSHIVPLCIPKVIVYINGSVTLNVSTWDDTKTAQLKSAFEKLNGFDHLNVTGQRLSDSIADFEAALSVKFTTSKVQEVVTALETTLQASVKVDTVGMVTIEAPDGTVCYESSPTLTCRSPEETTDAAWFVNKQFERSQLNPGSVVKLNTDCNKAEDKSCIAVTLQKVTGIWAGTYECGFSSGSVRHTAKAELKVALLPDQISLNINPLTIDCTENDRSDLKVTATIPNSTENFTVRWKYRDRIPTEDNIKKLTEGYNLAYEFTVQIDCTKSDDPQYVCVTFENAQNQNKSARVDIPVIYEGEQFCEKETINGEIWPKSPSGDTVINRTCPVGRIGFKSRTCIGKTWGEVFPSCISEELNKISNTADNFLKGLGATQEVARDIFQGLKNSSTADSESGDTTADIGASINILNVMANASQNIVLNDDVFPDLVNAASNMLNKTWNGVNQSIVNSMSSSYLQSVEGLVKNINVNRSNGQHSDNLDLKFCTSSNCNVTVFDVGVNLNKTTGMMKTVCIKNLMDKLKNDYSGRQMKPTSFVISVTLTANNDSTVEIELNFPQENQSYEKSFCVFWNTTLQDWSDKGCTLKTGDGNRTVCQCDHLTAFSVLMSKGDISDISNDFLDIITSVGLGVSVCSLLIFLIVEFLVWSAVVKSNLSLFRHTALVNIAVFLLLANSCFLASSSPKDIDETWCLVFTVCKHLFFLAMFSWMLCMSVMLVHQLIFVFSPLRKRVFMFISSIVGYICPILIVGCSYVYCKYTKKELLFTRHMLASL
ncbi:Adhesion G-protein coupled receptor F3 [Larimichthys crocea]|uniref:Uncharacterized protein n=1 Tax=Larimichthys crocea TaxID=215358 RepID=A0ACD3QYV9_LARCR|nr:Adhesion G-protein coupled receptor F3 [Larimichthys crocea]